MTANGKSKDMFVSATIPPEHVASLEKLAADSDRTRSAEIRRAIREYLERNKDKVAA